MKANEDKIKVGTVLIANENHFMFESTKRQFLTKDKEYVVKSLGSLDGFKLMFIIESDINKKHYFDVDTYNSFFTIKKP